MTVREVRITRTFDAPRELVFRAWLDPDQLAEWLAPAGLEVPRSSIEVDPRPGGVIAYSMVDPSSGRAYPVRFEIVELKEPEMFLFGSPPQPEFGFPERLTTRVVFDEDGGRTTVRYYRAGSGRHSLCRNADRGRCRRRRGPAGPVQ